MNNPLPPNLIVARADGGLLLHNLAMFSLLLRRAGFGGGAQKTATAAAALSCTGVEKRADVFWALAAVYVEKREQLPLFRRAFNIFWHGSDNAEETATSEIAAPFSVPSQDGGGAVLQKDAAPTHKTRAAAQEHLAEKDFAKMTEEEWRAAMRINRTLTAALPPPPSRRKIAATRGTPDMRRTIRRAFARGGDIAEIRYVRAGKKPAALIVLTDISGSMGVYSRAFLHFIAGMYANGGNIKTRAFLLGTRLTALRVRGGDAQSIAESIAAAARDWDGGTRLTPLLREFNHIWLRRINAAAATVLFVTDGLEVNFNDAAFAAEVERLQKSCRKLVWLNPLLRYEHYEPLARGAKILARHADEIRPVHNVRAVMQLADEVLTAKTTRRGLIAAI